MNSWVALVLAGIFEIGFTLTMKLSDGFTKISYTALFWACAAASFTFLSQAVKTIPLGTAYAVWTGIGACGTAVIGMLFFKDPVNFGRIFFLTTLLGSIIGLKLVSANH